MSIRNDSKKIIQYFIDRVIAFGSLDAQFPLNYEELSKTLDLRSDKYCKVCCQYLESARCISLVGSGDKRAIQLYGKAIDFIELP